MLEYENALFFIGSQSVKVWAVASCATARAAAAVKNVERMLLFDDGDAAFVRVL